MNRTIRSVPPANRDRLRALLRRRFRELAASRRPPHPAPRYDDVFFQGQRWLDQLAAADPPPPDRRTP